MPQSAAALPIAHEDLATLRAADRPRRGRSQTVRRTRRAEILTTTLAPPPERLGVTHWSSRLLAPSWASAIARWRGCGPSTTSGPGRARRSGSPPIRNCRPGSATWSGSTLTRRRTRSCSACTRSLRSGAGAHPTLPPPPAPPGVRRSPRHPGPLGNGRRPRGSGPLPGRTRRPPARRALPRPRGLAGPALGLALAGRQSSVGPPSSVSFRTSWSHWRARLPSGTCIRALGEDQWPTFGKVVTP
jgi:hypothetical protein